jgi:hypothetical protein
MVNKFIHSQLNNILNDFKATYLDLVGGKLWAGVIASPTGLLFIVNSANDEDIEQAHAMAAIKKLLFDEWVKLHAICHHCGVRGHIHPHCPKYIKQTKSGEIRLPPTQCPNPKVCQNGRPFSLCPFLKNPFKAKAFLSAFQALFETVDDNADNGDNANNDDVVDTNARNNKDDLHGFLLMVGSLKE